MLSPGILIEMRTGGAGNVPIRIQIGLQSCRKRRPLIIGARRTATKFFIRSKAAVPHVNNEARRLKVFFTPNSHSRSSKLADPGETAQGPLEKTRMKKTRQQKDQ
jgi:hypothetical protein